MRDVQQHRDPVSVAGSAGLREGLEQAVAGGRRQREQLQHLQRMPRDLVAVPAHAQPIEALDTCWAWAKGLVPAGCSQHGELQPPDMQCSVSLGSNSRTLWKTG